MDTDQDEDLEGAEQPDESGKVAIKLEDLRKLRKSAKRSDAHAGEVEGLKREVAVLRAGLNLKPQQLKALWSVHEGEMTPEALKQTAGDLGFVEIEEETEEDTQAREAATAIQRATAGATPPGKSALLTAESLTGWTQEKQMRFRVQHPQEWAAILRDPEAKVTNPGGAW